MRNELLFALVPLALMAQIQPVRTVTSQAQRLGNQPVSGFQNGYLYFVDDRASVRVYSPEGFPVLTTVVQIPDADNVWVNGLAVDTDGTFAIGVAYGASARAGGIAFYNNLRTARRTCHHRIVCTRESLLCERPLALEPSAGSGAAEIT
jgi:hypothetical protein